MQNCRLKSEATNLEFCAGNLRISIHTWNLKLINVNSFLSLSLYFSLSLFLSLPPLPPPLTLSLSSFSLPQLSFPNLPSLYFVYLAISHIAKLIDLMALYLVFRAMCFLAPSKSPYTSEPFALLPDGMDIKWWMDNNNCSVHFMRGLGNQEKSWK